VVAASTEAPRDGRFIEQLGHYDPTREPAVVNLKLDKIEAWVRNGALPTPTVARLMKKAGWKGVSSSAAKPSAATEG
jgi:small subunit ribosomal protein S16